MFGLDVDTIRQIRNSIEEVGVIEKALIYGSRARGNYKHGSDVDLTLVGRDITSKNSIYPLQRKLDKLCLPYMFDISVFKEIKDLQVVEQILDIGKVFYKRKAESKWPIVKLSNVCEILGGGTPSTSNPDYWNGDIPWITPKDLSLYSNIYISKGKKNITALGLKKSSAKLIPKNSVVLSSRAPIGYVAIVETPLTTNQGFRNLILNKKCISKYIFYFLASRTKELNSLGEGTTFKELSGRKLKEFKIPLPPIEEQKKIVEFLEKSNEFIDKTIQDTEKIINNLKELFKSYTENLLSNKNNKWPIVKLEKVCHLIRGPFGGSLKKEIFKPSGYLVYEQYHAINNDFKFARYFIDSKKFLEMKRFEVLPGDLLVSCSGTMGKVCIVPEKSQKGIINQALLKLTPHENEINGKYLKLMLESSSVQQKHFKNQSGTGIQNVSSVKTTKKYKNTVTSDRGTEEDCC